MSAPGASLPEGIRAKAAEMNLSAQQLRIVELLLQHKRVSEVAAILGTTQAVVHTQLSRIRAKAGALERRRYFQQLARDVKDQFTSDRARIVYLRQKGCTTKLISELLGLKYQKVADVIRRARGRYWIIEVPPPDPERLASPAPENCPVFKTAVSLYFHSFVRGDLSPESQEGRYRLLCAATGGAGGWRGKKILLTERARLMKEWAERSRATRETAIKALDELRQGRVPAPARNSLRICEDADGKRSVAPEVRWVLENFFVRVTTGTWKPRSPLAWRILEDAIREEKHNGERSEDGEASVAC